MDWVLIFGLTFLKMIPSFILALTALRLELRFSRVATAGLLIGCMGLMGRISGFLLLSEQMPYYGRLLWSVMAFILGIAFYFLLLKGNVWKILFIQLFVKGYADCVNLIAVGMVQRYTKQEMVQPFSLLLVVTTAMMVLFTSVPMWILLRKALFPVIDSMAGVRIWKYLWINPMLLYLLHRLAISNQYVRYDSSPYLTTAVAMVWTLTIFVSDLIMIRILVEADTSSRLQEKLRISEIQAMMRNQQDEDTARAIRQTYEARHDLRHHMLAMQGYMNNGDMNGLRKYLNEMVQATEEKGAILCENPAVSTILWYYWEQAREKNIQMDLVVRLPKVLPISESDCCVVLGNLLENAVEAADTVLDGEARFVKGTLTLAGENKLAILMKNSYGGAIHQTGEVFLSTKHKGEGIGTASVRRVVRKYSGVTRFTFQNGIFEASVLFNY